MSKKGEELRKKLMRGTVGFIAVGVVVHWLMVNIFGAGWEFVLVVQALFLGLAGGWLLAWRYLSGYLPE